MALMSMDHSGLENPASIFRCLGLPATYQCSMQPETLDLRDYLPVLTQDRNPSQNIVLLTRDTISATH